LHIPHEAIAKPSISPDLGIVVTREFDFSEITGLASTWQDPQLPKTKFETNIDISKYNNIYFLLKVSIIKLQ
jgi:hypothetical protein